MPFDTTLFKSSSSNDPELVGREALVEDGSSLLRQYADSLLFV
jgi:hypothetical protein